MFHDMLVKIRKYHREVDAERSREHEDYAVDHDGEEAEYRNRLEDVEERDDHRLRPLVPRRDYPDEEAEDDAEG